MMKNPDVKSSFPINFKTITLEYLNYLMFNKPLTFEKTLERFKKNQNNYAEALILEKRKTILGNPPRKSSLISVTFARFIRKRQIEELKTKFFPK